MKKGCGLLIVIFLISACGKTDKDKLADELILVIAVAEADKREQAKRDYDRYSRSASDKNIKDEGFSSITIVHNKATLFYDSMNLFVEEYRYKDIYPQDELFQRFTACYDSISALVPDLELKPFDYTQSSHKENLMLTALRMNYEMAVLEVDVMTQLAENYWVTIYRDDFR